MENILQVLRLGSEKQSQDTSSQKKKFLGTIQILRMQEEDDDANFLVGIYNNECQNQFEQQKQHVANGDLN